MKMCTKNFDFLSILFMQMCIEINLDILFTMLMTVRQEIIWKILILLKQKLMHSSKTKSTLYNLDRVTYKSCSMPFIQSKKSTQPAWTDWKSCNIKIPLQITLQGKARRQSLALVFVETPYYEIQKKKRDSRTIKSSYPIWIARSLWTLVCSISNISLFANFLIIPTFPCSMSQDFNTILWAFCFLLFTLFFSFHIPCSVHIPNHPFSTLNSPLNVIIH